LGATRRSGASPTAARSATCALPRPRLGKTAALASAKSGSSGTRFAIPTARKGLVGIAEKYLRKGSKVYVEGQLETRKWQDQSGQDRYTTEVVLRPYNGTLTLLDGRRDGNGGGSGSDYGGGSGGGSGYGSGGRPSSGSDIDNEIPFAPEWRI